MKNNICPGEKGEKNKNWDNDSIFNRFYGSVVEKQGRKKTPKKKKGSEADGPINGRR
jgi:hypothetical protein